MTKSRPTKHKWEFAARFRRGAFGWKSAPAMKRIKEAVAEIEKQARIDAVVAAEGAVVLLEKLSPAIEAVDSSSGSIGTAVDNAVGRLVPLIAAAAADPETRRDWLERLWQALVEDQVPYLESLPDRWAELCADARLAGEWVDRLIQRVRAEWNGDPVGRDFNAATICLSSLFCAGRYDELFELLRQERRPTWMAQQWGVRALAAMGQTAAALEAASACDNPYGDSVGRSELCEQILLDAGRVEEAYQRFGLSSNAGTTYLATFRAIAKKYPHKQPQMLLADLVAKAPGCEGRWFAAAKDLGMFEQAIALVQKSPTDPRTLARAARDYAQKEPAFAVEAGMAALRWMAAGEGYEITWGDILVAIQHTLLAAANAGSLEAVRQRMLALSVQPPGHIVKELLIRELRSTEGATGK